MSDPRLARRLLENLTTAVLLCDTDLRLVYLNPAAENLFAASLAKLHGKHCDRLIGPMHGLDTALDNALANNWSYTGHNLSVDRQIGGSLQLDCTVSPVLAEDARILLEFRPIDQQLRHVGCGLW